MDGLTCVDIEVKNGLFEAIRPAKLKKSSYSSKKSMVGALTTNVLDVAGGIVFPTFADLHTHIGAKRPLNVPPASDCAENVETVASARPGRT